MNRSLKGGRLVAGNVASGRRIPRLPPALVAACLLIAWPANPAVAGPIDALGDTPVLGGTSSSTAGPESEPGREEYVHIRSTDVWDSNRFWYTNRPN
ncbi:MAG TPA: hypothetical protein VHY20_01745, partial [Pirellulales bacterium]|nr:hypothetical protein [Pirellulales bacterium]